MIKLLTSMAGMTSSINREPARMRQPGTRMGWYRIRHCNQMFAYAIVASWSIINEMLLV